MEEHGVVSEETALAMVAGAADALEADVTVAVTGSAGPTPLDAPVGTMVIAVRTPDGARARILRLPFDRERARTFASTAALQLLRLAVTGEWW
jgi:nicotinamide mononucleotide (NMN) deamidase PncC